MLGHECAVSGGGTVVVELMGGWRGGGVRGVGRGWCRRGRGCRFLDEVMVAVEGERTSDRVNITATSGFSCHQKIRKILVILYVEFDTSRIIYLRKS